MTDVIIIGAGTAGMTAAIYAAREGLDTLILEKKVYGGQIINSLKIENYPGFKEISGYEFATALYEQAVASGAKLSFEETVSVDKNEDSNTFTVKTTANIYKTRAVIKATGAEHRKLGVAKEDEMVGKGISYCATCDGAFFKGKDTAVVGGGNTALQDAIFLSDYCSKVYLIHRRDSYRGEERYVKQLEEKENVELVKNAVVTGISGTDMLEEITVKFNDGTEKKISVEGLFVAVGQTPDTKQFANVVQLDEGGYIIAGEDCKTNTEGVFVAGDCRTKDVRQLTTAASDGAVSALSAIHYLKLNN